MPLEDQEMRSILKIVQAATIGLLVSVFASSQSAYAATSCSDGAITKQVSQIVRENPGKFLSGLLFQEMLKGNSSLGPYQEGRSSDGSAGAAGVFDMLEKFKNEAEISVNTIRLRERNSDTGMLVCVAIARYKVYRLSYDLTLEIAYTIEKSSDGDYVEVYGLQ